MDEVLKQLAEENLIVRAMGQDLLPVVVGGIDRSRLMPGRRVALNMTTLTIVGRGGFVDVYVS